MKTQKKEPKDLKGTKMEPKSKLTPIKSTRKLHVSHFQVAEFARQAWHVIPVSADTIEDTLRPEYWAHICARVSINDKIEAIWDDGTKYVEYKVLNKGDSWLKVAIINQADFAENSGAEPEAEAAKHEVKWGGPHLKWMVVRISDGQRLTTDHASRDSAERWLVEHKKAL